MINLDKEQYASIIAKSPIIVNAAAGSGKTRCLIAKIAKLLENGTQPKNICAITFTNKAAKEMKERLKQNNCTTKDMQVSTIHSLCVRIIKTFPQHTYMNVPFSIYDSGDQTSVIKTIVKARNLRKDAKELINIISKAKSEKSEGDLKGEAKIVYKAYTEILFKNNACDFDDLLLFACDCLKHPDCVKYFSQLWHHILVDEFQDTSKIQYEIIKSLYNKDTTKTLFVICDWNQSIYSWRGANPSNIKSFIDNYKPSICNLTYNYRCSQSVIEIANNFLQFGSPMTAQSSFKGSVSLSRFETQEDEANKIAKAILSMGNYENTAILFRINARSILFEKTFSQQRIPYKVVGALPFYRRKVVKDLLAFCKAGLNHSDLESLVRIVNIPKRGFGAKKQESLLTGGWPYLRKMATEMPSIKSLISLLEDIKHKDPFKAISTIIHTTNYRDTIQTDNNRTLLDSFLNVVSGYNTTEELILASTFIEEDSGHGIKLMSAHASKGLEFDYVFVVGMEEDVWPHMFSSNIDEENRLFYVACTRAKKYLNISYSKSKIYRGTKIGTPPSPTFIKLIRKKKT